MGFKETQKEYHKTIKSMNKDLKGIFDELYKQSTERMDSITPVNWSEYVPPCGITERAEGLTEEQIRDADTIVDNVVTQIMDNPDDYPIIESQVPPTEKGTAGTGAGTDVGRVPMMQVEYPEWLRKITSSLKGFYTRKKGRKGLDYEELIKGIFRKPKTKMKRQDDALYVFMDTSGSMWGYTDHYGTPLLKLFSSFFPQIAKKYDGEIWFSDYSPYNSPEPIKNPIPLKVFRGQTPPSSVAIGGKGGTEFWGVWQYFDKKSREAKEKNQNARVMMIFFSDMEADFGDGKSKDSRTDLLPLIENKDVLFITVKGKGEEVEHLIDGEQRRLIYIDAKPPKE